MSKYVVIWSGGADSTALLNHYAKSSSANFPVTAFSVDGHNQLHEGQSAGQIIAKNNYLKLAKERGYHINPISFKVDCDGSATNTEKGGSVQMLWWVTMVAPYVDEGDTVVMGYIRRDGVWHWKHELVEAFNALMRLRCIKADLVFPYEWYDKKDVLDALKKDKIPNN